MVAGERRLPSRAQFGQAVGDEGVGDPVVDLDEGGEVARPVRGGPAGDDEPADQGDPADRGGGERTEQDLAVRQVPLVPQPVPSRGLAAQAEAGHQGVPDDEFGGLGEVVERTGAGVQLALPGRLPLLAALVGGPAPAAGDQVGAAGLAGLPEVAAGVGVEAFARGEDQDVPAGRRVEPGVAQGSGGAGGGVGVHEADPVGVPVGEGAGGGADDGVGGGGEHHDGLGPAQRLVEHGGDGGAQGGDAAGSLAAPGDHAGEVDHACSPSCGWSCASIRSTTPAAAFPSSRSQNASRNRW